MNTVAIKFGGKTRQFKFNFNSDAIICEGMSQVLEEPLSMDDFGKFLAPEVVMVKKGKKEVPEERNHRYLTYRNRFLIWMYYSGLHNHAESTNDLATLDEINYHKVADWMSEMESVEDGIKVMNAFLRLRQVKEEENNGQSRKGEPAEKKN